MTSPATQTATSGLIEPFRLLWRHRQLFRRVLLRDIQSSFRGSILGLAWVVLIPLVFVALYTFVFGRVLGSAWVSGEVSAYETPLIFFAGLMILGFFMEVMTRSPNSIRDNRVYVTKVVFPLEILSWVVVGTALFKFCVNLFLLLVFLVLATGKAPAGALLLPLLMLPFLLITVGLSWILAGVGAFVRDISHAIQALTPLLMFISPVFYSVAQVPEQFRGAYFVNPLTFMLESVRDLLFFEQVFSARAFLIYSLVAALVFTGGFRFFRRLRPGFADVA